MKIFVALGIMALASAASGAANAAPSDYSDFDIVSVAPRSPDVRPFLMSAPAREHKHAAPLQMGSRKANR